ncbi:MAG: hypothetical protein P4L99_23695 [Chthoniobacter sp.]|nr:hypothetical protein [Chthoniobacter sp.]
MSEPARKEPTPFERFQQLATQVVNVPKEKADAEFHKMRAEREATRSKPGKRKAA